MKVPERRNPSTTDTLGGEVEEGFDELGKLPSRLEKYAVARKRAVLNLAHIDHVLETANNQNMEYGFFARLQKIKPRLKKCGSYLGFKNYYTIGRVRLTTASFCKSHLICPLCAIRRGAKTLKSYTDRFHIIKKENPQLKLSMVTLTVKNGEDLEERYLHLKKSVETLLMWRRKALKGVRGYKTEFSKAKGLVGAYEVTNKEKGWHPHVHMMVLHEKSFSYTELQEDWKRITGDSHVLNVTPAQNPKNPVKDFMEVFKYCVKFGELTVEQNFEVLKVFSGKRLLFSAGLFRGVKVPESLLDEELDDLPYIEYFYRYIDGSGYNATTLEELKKNL